MNTYVSMNERSKDHLGEQVHSVPTKLSLVDDAKPDNFAFCLRTGYHFLRCTRTPLSAC